MLCLCSVLLSPLELIENLCSLVLLPKAIANSEHMARLTTLDLHNSAIGAARAQAIALSPHMANLTTRYLAGNQIGDDGAAAVLE